MPSTAVTLTARFEVDTESLAAGMKIGNVVWAWTNLSGNNTFAVNVYDYGALFQFGSSVAYSYTGGTAPSYPYSATSWPESNDPCPDGWHVPTQTEMQAMLNAATAKTWTTSGLIYGMRYTFSGGTLFLPAAGTRNYYSGAVDQGSVGYYWSSTYNGSSSSYRLYFDSGSTGSVDNNITNYGFSVRCVRPQ
jgi:uncharacterized protein (TIGR02145 family)